MTLTKSDIITDVQQETGFTKKIAADVVETLIELIKQSLEDEEDVLVSGFGKFCVKEKAPRRGRNPVNGEEMELWGRRVVTFKYSAKLREKINRSTF